MGNNIKRFEKTPAGIKSVGLRWSTTVGMAGSPIAAVDVTPTNETNPGGSVNVLGAITFDPEKSITQFIAQNGESRHRYKFKTKITLENGRVYEDFQYMDVI